MMTYFRILSALLGCALFISLSACSDPASVGEDLGSDALEGGDPKTVEVAPSLRDTAVVPRTGRLSPPGPPGTDRPAWRFLTGIVDDPLAGTIAASGFIDFLGANTRPESVENEAPLSAELRFEPTYVHGDTLSSLTLKFFEISEEAEMNQARADTLFPEGEMLGTKEISFTDSLVTFSLPSSWIDDHEEALRSDTTFNDQINGFKIIATDEPSTNRKGIIGFDHTESFLRVTTPSDTVDFNSLKSFTHIEEREAPNLSEYENYSLLRDGIGSSLLLDWDFNSPPLDTLRNAPLNQADVTAPLDLDAMEGSLDEAPPTFVRPSINGFRVLAKRKADAPRCRQIGFPPLPENREVCILPTVPRWAPGAARLSSETAFRFFEQAFLDAPFFSTFRVQIATRENENQDTQSTIRVGLPSTAPALVRTANPESIEDLPRATLTITPL